MKQSGYFSKIFSIWYWKRL